MTARRSIRSRHLRRRIHRDFELPLTSLMDVLVIILVFLLKSYSASTSSFAPVPGLQLPTSGSPDQPIDSLSVVVTPEGMSFENERILDFVVTAAAAGSSDTGYEFKATDLDEEGRRVLPLFNALMRAKEKSELLRAKSSARTEDGKPLPFEGILAIQADKRIQYETLRRVMYTAAAAGYPTFRFLALKRDQ